MEIGLPPLEPPRWTRCRICWTRSVGAREYIIRSAAGADPLIDLKQLDFEQLTLRFAAAKRTAASVLQKDIEQRLLDAVAQEPDPVGAWLSGSDA